MSSFNQKGSAHIFIILIILVVIGVLIWRFVITTFPIYGPPSKDFSQLPPMTTDPTRVPSVQPPYDKKETLPNGQIRYTNFRDNYQIDLPSNWQVKLLEQDPQYGPSFSLPSGYDYGDPNSPDWYGLHLGIDYSKVKGEIQKIYEDAMSSNPQIKIDGLDTIRVAYGPKPQADIYYGVHYTIKRDSKHYYELEFGTSSKQTMDTNISTINQIANSFKILDKTEKPITLLTFTNPILGYSFKYPSNWLVNTYMDNGNYNLGITVVDEDDQEMLTLYPRPGERNCSNWGGEPQEYDIPFQGKTYHMLHHIDQQCPQPFVRTKDGYEYRLRTSYGFPGLDNTPLTNLLNSIEGLTLIPRTSI